MKLAAFILPAILISIGSALWAIDAYMGWYNTPVPVISGVVIGSGIGLIINRTLRTLKVVKAPEKLSDGTA